MTAAARQTSFDLGIPVGRVLLNASTFMDLADRDEDGMVAAIESGALAWAFDIAAPGVSRREIRIHRDSVLDYLRGESLPAWYGSDAEVSRMLAACVPFEGRAISAVRLRRAWSCSSTHVLDLIRAGCLDATTPAWRSGPGGSPQVLLSSVRQFIKSRRIL